MIRLPMLPRHPFAPCLLLPLALAAACGRGPAYGSDNAIIAVVDPAVSEEVTPLLRESLERRVYTTRSEPIFEVTFTTPERIGEFKKWRRLVVVETDEEPVLLPDLVDTPLAGPAVSEIRDEWARNQTVYVVAAPTEAATVELVRSSADSLFRRIHEGYVQYHIQRMWASGGDSALARRLQEELGFSLLLPRVYKPAGASAPLDTRVWFNVDPRRVVSVHWRAAPDELTADAILVARREWGHDLFPGDSIEAMLGASPDTIAAETGETAGTAAGSAPPPDESVQIERLRLDGLPAIRVQGRWSNASDVSGGVFVTYGVICGKRLVLLDGNIYAPDRGKYPYVLQLDQILQTFRCGEGGVEVQPG